MNITRENIDELNAVVKVDIAKEDYAGKVEKILKDYRKNANIPGFRKGHVPMGMVKKQYGQAVLVDEVNKLLQEVLTNTSQKKNWTFWEIHFLKNRKILIGKKKNIVLNLN